MKPSSESMVPRQPLPESSAARRPIHTLPPPSGRHCKRADVTSPRPPPLPVPAQTLGARMRSLLDETETRKFCFVGAWKTVGVVRGVCEEEVYRDAWITPYISVQRIVKEKYGKTATSNCLWVVEFIGDFYFRLRFFFPTISIYFHQFGRSVVSDPLRPRGLLHANPPCPSPTPGAYSNMSFYFHKKEKIKNRSNCQHPLDHGKSKRVPEKHLFLLY